jgi:hypothetical protein
VSRTSRRDVRLLLQGSKTEVLIRAAALYPTICESLTGLAYTICGDFLAPLNGRSLYGDERWQSSPGWPPFVVPPVVYWFGVVPVMLVTILWVLDRPARHMPEAAVLVPLFLGDAVVTAVLSGFFPDLEAWPHDLWMAAVVMAACAVVVTTVALRRRRRRRRAARS